VQLLNEKDVSRIQSMGALQGANVRRTPKAGKKKAAYGWISKRDGGDSGIRTPDLRIMMKIAPIFFNKINGLQAPNPAV